MVKFAKALAANTDLDTAQSFTFFREPVFFGAIISAQGDDCFTLTRQVTSDLEEKLFESDEPIPQRLDKALNLLQINLSGLSNLGVLLVGLGEDHILYLKGIGTHRVYLKRGQQTSLITPQALNTQLISGYLEEGDRLLLVSSSFEEEPDKLFQAGVEGLEDELEGLIVGKERIEPITTILVDNRSPEIEQSIAQPQIINLENLNTPKVKLSIPQIGPLFLRAKDYLPTSKKGRLYLGLSLFLVVFIGIFLSTKNKSEASKNAQFNSLLSSAKGEYDEAQSLKDLDSVKAQDDLNKAKKDLSLALALKPNDSQAKDLKNQVDQNGNQILRVYKIDNFPLYLDLNLIKDGFSASKISLSVGNILMLDTNQKTLVEVNLDKKTNQILAGSEQLGSPLYASLNGDFAYVYSEKGIVKVDTKAVKSTVVVKTDADWGRIEDINAFAGNLYILDGIKNQIWKYTPVGSGYSDKLTYLKDNSKTDFAGGKRMLIDSSVWVLKTGSEIDKYTSGVPDSFNISGLDQDLKDVTAFFVSDEGDNVYLLDSGKSRLVVVKKNGQYVSQYQGDRFKDIQDLVVDEKDKKIYLLSNNKIYQIELK